MENKNIDTYSPLFSVLIANYNNGKYLMDAVESVRKQTYANWEIIIVDDVSTDNSFELYEVLRDDNRIHIYLNQENMGCGYTKRRCAELAMGELCGFLDPDDALTDNAIELMVKEHSKLPEASLVYSLMWICDEDLNMLYTNENFSKSYLAKADFLHRECVISHFVSYKKIFYKLTQGIDATFLRAVDQDLYLKLEEVGLKGFCKKPLYLYRVHVRGISLGENEEKALYWHIQAIKHACNRRNISKEAEVIVASLLYEYSKKNQLRILQKQLTNPSIIFISKLFWKWIKRVLKK